MIQLTIIENQRPVPLSRAADHIDAHVKPVPSEMVGVLQGEPSGGARDVGDRVDLLVGSRQS